MKNTIDGYPAGYGFANSEYSANQLQAAEHTIDYKIGHILNDLINEGYLTVNDVTNAPETKFDTLLELEKFLPFLSRESIPPHVKEQIASLFREPAMSTAGEIDSRRSETIQIARNTYESLRNNPEYGDNLEGFLVFGSRLDPQRRPRDERVMFEENGRTIYLEPSDIDIVCIVKDDRLVIDPITSRVLEYPKRNYDSDTKRTYMAMYQGTQIPIEVAGIRNSGDFYTQLQSQEFGEEFPYWARNPQALHYIGQLSLPDGSSMGEEEVNSLIQHVVNSSEMADRRQKHLKKQKERFLQALAKSA